MNYYSRFKWVIKAAFKDKYFYDNPTEEIHAVSNPSTKLKDSLEADEYIKLVNTPCNNEEVKFAFIFCLYTGLRWVDIKKISWSDIKGSTLVTRIIQSKTGRPVVLTLHAIAQKILDRQKEKLHAYGTTPDLVFQLPTANGANKILGEWVSTAGIDKHITWSCARLSFSILLQDQRVDNATVSLLLGHTTTRQVERTYKRHRPKPQTEAVNVLPTPLESSRSKLPHDTQPVTYIYTYSSKN